jgi:AraC-like DNA-binding protein
MKLRRAVRINPIKTALLDDSYDPLHYTSVMADSNLITDASRDEEESRIVANWLKRLRSCLGHEQLPLFHQALKEVGIGLGDLDGGRSIHLAQLDRIVLLVRREVPDITLRLFSRVEVLDLGLIGYAAINSGTLGKALEVMYAYHSLSSDRYVDQFEIQDEWAVVYPAPLPGYLDDYQNIAEDSLAGNWRSLQILLGEAADCDKIKLHFDYREPAYLETYLQVFGPNCHFNQERSELRFPRAWLEVPINRSGGGLSQVFTAMCERILGPGETGTDTSEMVQRLLLSRSGRSMLRLEEAAEQLRLSPNQLRKRIYRAGTTYKALVLKTRMELARHYLLDTHMSVQEIAYLLDYATPAPFSRAFKQFFGLAPEYYRKAQAS